MKDAVYIDGAGGRRRVGPDDFPLPLGGTLDGAVDLAGIAPGVTVAWLGLAEDELFLQSGEGTQSVLCNGSPVAASQWLRHGDVIRIGETRIDVRHDDEGVHLVVEHQSRDEVTEPPEIRPLADPAADGDVETTVVSAVEFKPRVADGARRSRRRGLRLTALLLWIPLAALGTIAWIVFTSKSVELSVTPAPERLELHDAMIDFELGGRYLLRPGSYRLSAEKSGYRALDAEFEVTDEASQSFRFELEPLPGLVTFSGAPDGAELLVDDVPAGTAPLPALELSPGLHRVTLRAPRHRELVVEVDVAGRGVPQHVETRLEPLWAAVSLASEPSGAALLVDGRPAGSTPLTVELDAGRRRLELRLAGHRNHRQVLEVEAGRSRTLPVIRLRPAEATVNVTSRPPGAMVTVDGSYVGQTPLEIALEPGPDHLLELSKTGHEPESRELTLSAGDRRQLEVELAARVGEVTVSALPADAELWIDGVPRGRAAQTLQLPAVPQHIEIRKPGFEPYAVTLTPRPGFPQSVDVELQTPEQIEAARFPAQTRTAQGQSMVLVGGGTLMLGAPRREPGRRSNETEREVELTRRFYLAVTEVSNREFRMFDPKHVSGRAAGFNLEIDHHAVVRVTWAEAARYCNWLSEQEGLPAAYVESGGAMVAARPMNGGYRLPTEAEWAWAARYEGTPGEPAKYAWGDRLPVAPQSGNYADLSSAGLLASTLTDYNDGYPATAPVDSFPPNALGLFNLGGNVSEWVHDIYTVYAPGAGTAESDPQGPAEGQQHVIRGSSWMHSSISELRLSFRDRGREARPDVGFRIARYAE